MSGSFGERLHMPRGSRPCKHCGRGVSDHFLAMSEKRCFMPRESTRYEAASGDPDVLDADDLSALDQLFAALLRGGDTTQLMRRATMASAMRKLRVMNEQAKAQKAAAR